jgi:hypothetical protein
VPAISVGAHQKEASGIKLWEFYFQIRACCALMSAFNKIAGTNKIARKCFFLQANTFFAGKQL